MRASPPYFIVLASLGAVAVGCSTEADASRPSAASPVVVEVRRPHVIGRHASIEVSGVVDARRTVDVAFQVPGTVIAAFPEEGDEVTAGDALATLDPTDLRLNAERAKLVSDRANDELRRHTELFQRGSLASNDFERSTTAAGEASIASDLASEQLADARLDAPISGTVARRGVEIGEMVAAGAPVFTIMDLSTVDVRVGVAEADIGRVLGSETATIRVAAFPEREFTGAVQLVAVAADPVTRTYGVTIRVPNADRALRAGMVAAAVIATDQRVEALTVPGEAILRDPDGVTRVFVYDPHTERVRSRRVEVGMPRGTEVEIAGVDASEAIVVAGQHRLRDGHVVTLNAVHEEARQ